MTTTPEDLELLPIDQVEVASSLNPGGDPSTSAPGGITRSGGKRKVEVVVDENHPFDLEAYASSYNGRTAILRLLYIASVCPGLASQAYQLALQFIQQTPDTSLYLSTVVVHNNSLPLNAEPISEDTAWLNETIAKNNTQKERLEVELKTYLSNMIKESIRMSYRELGKYWHSVGDYSTCLKHYMKSREYCATSAHVLEMCLSVLEVLIEQQNYSHINTYVFKAESALDVPSTVGGPPGAGATTTLTGPFFGQSKKPSAPNPERSKIQAKLEFATGLAHLGQGNYQKAAYTFTKLGKSVDDWIGKVFTGSDVAIYGTLCALASLPRSAIKAAVIDSETFGYYLEQEPYVREILDAYMQSKFKDVLQLLDRHSSRHLLDIHLGPHVLKLMHQIRSRALVLYFQPFANVHLGRMAAAFGIDLLELEELVIKLIEEGQIKARIDSQNKILKAKDSDPRVELFTHAIESGLATEASTRKLLLRMKLLQADLVIPKNRDPPSQQQSLLTPQQSLTDVMIAEA